MTFVCKYCNLQSHCLTGVQTPLMENDVLIISYCKVKTGQLWKCMIHNDSYLVYYVLFAYM